MDDSRPVLLKEISSDGPVFQGHCHFCITRVYFAICLVLRYFVRGRSSFVLGLHALYGDGMVPGKAELCGRVERFMRGPLFMPNGYCQSRLLAVFLEASIRLAALDSFKRARVTRLIRA